MIIDVVPRAQWGAVPVTLPADLALKHPVTNVVFSYLSSQKKYGATPQMTRNCVKGLQLQQMAEGMPDIIYNFMVGGDGKLYEGRGWHFRPQRLDEFPEIDGTSINICFIGSKKFKQPAQNHWVQSFQLLRYGIRYDFLQYGYKLYEVKTLLEDSFLYDAMPKIAV